MMIIKYQELAAIEADKQRLLDKVKKLIVDENALSSLPGERGFEEPN